MLYHVISLVYPHYIPIYITIISPFISPSLLQSTHKSLVNRTEISKAQAQLPTSLVPNGARLWSHLQHQTYSLILDFPFTLGKFTHD